MSVSTKGIPSEMRAAVYRGNRTVLPGTVPVPSPGAGELLVRVEACGICHTDLKKIELDLLPAPRIFGHETAGVVVATGAGVTRFLPGDRVCFFHHIPCFECHYCRYRDYSQCPTYKRVGVTAGFEPAGGGFAQYVRIMDWIVRSGVERIPDHASFARATFVEPVNTCLKGLAKLRVRPGESVLVVGQGPIGLLFTALLCRQGVESIFVTDLFPDRLALGIELGAERAWLAGAEVDAGLRLATAGRGADVVIVAAAAPGIVERAISMSRRGGRVMLFAQTAPGDRFTLEGRTVCAGDRTLLGSYSACADLQADSAAVVWDPSFPVERLVTHKFRLEDFASGMHLANRPEEGALKLLVTPQD